MIFLEKHEKADSEDSAKWKKVKGKPGKINELILKTKGNLKEGPDNINSHLWFMLSFNWLVVIWRKREGVRLKLDVQSQGGGRILDVDRQGCGGLENWTILMDVIYVSS